MPLSQLSISAVRGGHPKRGQPPPPCTAPRGANERVLSHRRPSTTVLSYTSLLAEARGSLQARWVPKQNWSQEVTGIDTSLEGLTSSASQRSLPAACQGGIWQPTEDTSLCSITLCVMSSHGASVGRSSTTSPTTGQAHPQPLKSWQVSESWSPP